MTISGNHPPRSVAERFTFSHAVFENCNHIILLHQGASLKDKREFLVEKDAFSCRRHFRRDASRHVAFLPTRFLWLPLTRCSTFSLSSYRY
jgi:hypothetical protein